MVAISFPKKINQINWTWQTYYPEGLILMHLRISNQTCLFSRLFVESHGNLWEYLFHRTNHKYNIVTFLFISTSRIAKYLKASALVGELSCFLEHHIDDLLADGVVTSGVVVGGILLACDELFGMEQGSVCASPNFIWKFEIILIIGCWESVSIWNQL